MTKDDLGRERRKALSTRSGTLVTGKPQLGDKLKWYGVGGRERRLVAKRATAVGVVLGPIYGNCGTLFLPGDRCILVMWDECRYA